MDNIKTVSPLRCLILCAGEGTRWENHGGIPKHLLEIDGQTLLDRIIGQLEARGCDDIYIIANSPEYDRPGVKRLSVNSILTGTRADKFKSSEEHWNTHGDNLVMFGDVWFSDVAMDKITEVGRPGVNFYGRKGESRFTLCPWGELFCLKFDHESQNQISSLLNELAAEGSEHDYPPAGWWLYYQMNGRAYLSQDMAPNYVEIDDFTDDFDYAADLDRWLEARRTITISRLAPPSLNRDNVKPRQRAKMLIKASTFFTLGVIITLLIQALQ